MNRSHAIQLMIGADAPSAPLSTVMQAEAKTIAAAQATDAHPFVGVYYKQDGTNGFQIFDKREDLDYWYGKLADDQASYVYVASFIKTDKDSWPAPFAEFGNAIHTATVSVHTTTSQAPSKKHGLLGIILGTIGTGILGFAIAKRKHS